ncbi:HLA class II histocompatibility antigen, DR alpha chain [Pantherophis guttatus]|uniref:HLA class II histocompatibility antigen, DR alpha chain n=1 Tax=Pantherophis guttatus TaxID=94885 RepID=A0ABM3Z5Z5_PANGU|nr:HLA class II histocompatibility antigen, DR alpha chain [Pantherophis guttatus]
MAGKGNGVGGPGGLARLLLLFLALAELGRAQDSPVPGEEVLSQVAFVQKTRRNTSSSSEFMFEFDDDEIFHVDLEQRETIWRLPEFGRFTSFQAEGAQGNIAVLQSNLDILMKRSNYTPAVNVPPKVMVYPETMVEMEEPNILICMADGFSPPVLNMTWVKNGKPVTEGVQTMDYYPKKDHSFRRFSYLPFVPNADDYYACVVEHWGLTESLSKIWNANIPEPLPETTENVICALGLAIGLVGIVIGTILMIKSRKMGEASYRRGTL